MKNTLKLFFIISESRHLAHVSIDWSKRNHIAKVLILAIALAISLSLGSTAYGLFRVGFKEANLYKHVKLYYSLKLANAAFFAILTLVLSIVLVSSYNIVFLFLLKIRLYQMVYLREFWVQTVTDSNLFALIRCKLS